MTRRAALLLEIRIDPPRGTGQAWTGDHAEVNANRFLQQLSMQSFAGEWEWNVRIQFRLEQDTLGTAWTVLKPERGSLNLRDALVAYYRAAADEARALSCHRQAARHMVELLTGQPFPKPRKSIGEVRAAEYDAIRRDRESKNNGLDLSSLSAPRILLARCPP